MKIIVFLLLFVPVIAFGTTINIVTKSNVSIIQYSVSELKSFLNEGKGFKYINEQKNADWVLTLVRDTTLKEGAFRVTSSTKGHQQIIELSGCHDNDILYAVYTFLEKLGYTFEITGFQAPEIINVNAVKNYAETVVPVVKYRGIRQHINFPMDMSSYSIEDAKQYIRNLARMRLNYICFHSYPGQWLETKTKDSVAYAGNFFYTNTYKIDSNPLIQKYVHNKKVFCIPEIEPFYDNAAVKSKMAVSWLNEVMKEAKRVGMRVEFSFEPRSVSADVEETISVIAQIQQQYPFVDVIQMMTEESGGWGPFNTAEETRSILTRFFGSSALNDTTLTRPIRARQSDLGYLYGEVGHCIKVIETIKKRNIKTPVLKLGIYSTINGYSIPAYHLARKYAPLTEVCIMPGHGSGEVAGNTDKIISKDEDWDKTTIFSWLEFDGMMYLQQNGIVGIYNLMKRRMDEAPGSRFNAIAFNHWRTAENKITARYAALSSLFGPIEPDLFYKDYAQRIGIASPNAFSNGMQQLQAAYDFKKSNMGFAWMGYWNRGVLHFESPKSLEGAMALYKISRKTLRKCENKKENAYAANTIRFLDNRLQTTIFYYQAFLKLNGLRDKSISIKKYEKISHQVIGKLDDYMKTYSEMMPDRGCEGTLISLYLSPINAIKTALQKKIGQQVDKPVTTKHFDAPAPPIVNGGN